MGAECAYWEGTVVSVWEYLHSNYIGRTYLVGCASLVQRDLKYIMVPAHLHSYTPARTHLR